MVNPFMSAPTIAEDIDAERLAARARADNINKPTAKADTFLESMALGAKKRALGLAQLGAETFGYDDTETYRDMRDLAKQYNERGTGTGFKGGVAEALGDPMTALGLAIPAVKGAGLLGSAGKLAATGAAFGGADRLTGALEGGQSRAEQTAYGAAGGAVLAPLMAGGAQMAGRAIEKTFIPAAEKLSRPAVNAFKQAANYIRSNPDDALSLEIKGMDADALNNAIKGLSDDAAKQFKQAAKSGLNKRQAYLAAKFQEKGGMMTRGQAAQDPSLQRLEDMARMGVLGDDAYGIANNQEQLNQGALRRWAGELLTDVTGNPNAVVDETTTGDILGGALRERYKELKTPMQAAYRAGMKSKAKVAMQNLQDFPSQVRTVLRDKGIDLADTQAFKTDYKALQKLTRNLDDGTPAIKSVKWPALERMVQRTNSKAQWDVPLSTVSDFNRRQDIMAYRAMATEMRERQDDLLLNGVLENVDEAAKMLREAPSLNKAFRGIFDKKNPLTRLVENDATDREVVDLLGSGVIGKKNTTRIVRDLKSALGDDSEAINQVRGTFLNRIMKRAYNTGDDAKFGQAVKSELKKLKSQNKELYDELYTPQQQQAIEDFADVANQLNATVRSRTNPSGSGIVAGDLVVDTLRRMGGAGSIVAEGLQAITGQAGKEVQGASAIRSITEPLKSLPIDTRVISEALSRSAKPAAGRFGGYIAQEIDEPSFMDTEGVETRIDVTPDDIQENPFMSDELSGSSGNDTLQIENPFLADWQPSANMLSGRTEYDGGADKPLSPQQTGFQVPRDYLQSLAMAESSGNPLAQAKTSSAKGLFQFTDGTWNSMVKRYGEELGVTKADIFDPQAQTKMAIKLTQENARILRNKMGRNPTNGELYAAHFLGPSGAAKMLNKKGSGIKAAKINPAAAEANRSIFFDNGRARTVDEVLAILNRKVSS